MIINGSMITTSEELETAIAAMDSASQDAMRAIFAGDNPTPPMPSTFELDKLKYKKRALALNNIMAEIAAENVGRVRDGLWTVDQLIALTQDAGVKQIISDLSALSFEIAHSKIDALTPEILTTEIKQAFKDKLAANFF